jgi:TrmH family RNA methyltransferase
VPTPIKVATRQHAMVQACRALAHGRGEPGTVLLDGAHLIADALHAGVRLRAVIALVDADPPLVGRVRASGAAIYVASEAILDAASPVRTPSGIVAIADWCVQAIADALAPAPALAIGLVDVQDPGNVGSAIRSGHALGASGVLALGSTADPAGWKALRGAMGSTFRIPVAQGTVDEGLRAAQDRGVQILATTLSGATPIDRVDLTLPSLVLLGNEGSGLSPALAGEATHRITVPMRPGVDSLNVAVTAALILYEARRQRGTAPLAGRPR